jgi:hypothetical protein
MSVSYKKLWKLLIDKDMKKKDLEKAAGISNYDAVVLMGLFTFLFLGAEYLYVDVLSRIVSEDKTVLAQNYALGVSAAGFLLYPLFNRFCKERLKTICFLFIGLLSVLGIAFIGVVRLILRFSQPDLYYSCFSAYSAAACFMFPCV